MQSENVKEYELIRDEMSTVKDCITRHIGFVLGGSGVAAGCLGSPLISDYCVEGALVRVRVYNLHPTI